MYIHVQEGSVTVEKKCNQRSLKNVIKRAFGKLDNIFQNDCLKKKKKFSQQSTNVRFFLSHN